MVKNYRFAGVECSVQLPDERAFTDERALAIFAVGSVHDPYWFDFEMVDKLTAPHSACAVEEPGFREYQEGEWSVRYIGPVSQSWEDARIRIARMGKEHRVQLLRSQYAGCVGVHTVLNCLAAEHLVARENGFIFHSSYIDWNGKGILFTAPSGTGKSTQAELWRSLRGAEIINGDRSAVRFVDESAIAEGVPFSGSSQICVNRSLPLAAVVYLSQAPQTTIRKLRGYEAFSRIWEGVSVNTWDAEDMRLVSGTVEKVASAVPVYHLACTPDESAVIALERMLREG